MTRYRHLLISSIAGGVLFAGTIPAGAQEASSAAATDPLIEGFRAPPPSARPRVWWHWMNGNVTRDGIEKDLAWMERIGIGGVQNFDASLATPQIVPERLIYMSAAWKDAFRHAVELADAKGMEFAIAASPGWSETGGPWVKPEDGMKKLVWSQTLVKGGTRLAGTLATPPSTTGPFQDAPFSDPQVAGNEDEAPHFYSDVAVFAYPITAPTMPKPVATVTGDTPVNAALLNDGSMAASLRIAAKTGDAATALTYDYDRPVRVRSATLYILKAKFPYEEADYHPVLEAEVDGRWQRVTDIPLTEAATTVAFAPVTARRFRLTLNPAVAPQVGTPGEGAPGAIGADYRRQPTKNLDIAEFSLSGEARIDQFEAKAGYAVTEDYDGLYGRSPLDAPAIDPARVVDVTSRLRPDGTLDWTAPKGSDWRIVRLGYSLTGKTNHPATAEATGLEVDKYDAAAVRRYLETYLGMYRDAVGPDLMGKRGIRALLTDSIEVGAANWTPRMMDEFRRRRGYDPRPWLPALTGVVVGTVARSEAFLHDYRQTLADLIADAHYGTIASVAHEHGLTVYGEALEVWRPSLGDDLAMRSHADIPMAALWTYNRDSHPSSTLIGDMRGAASVAHVLGHRYVAAESLTSKFAPYAFAPSDLKRVIDLEFASGINRPVIHSSVHQPVDDKVPGLSLMIFGQYFNRHDTWAEMAKPWVDYIARSSFLLQQGRNHADIAYFYGEDIPVTALFKPGAPADLPTRYPYDFVNGEMLADQLGVDRGEIVSKGGARYKALYLGSNSRVMTLATLRNIEELVQAGATVIGAAPERSPSLDDPAAFRSLVSRLWSGQPVTRLGQGQVIADRNLESALANLGLTPDFRWSGGASDSEYLFLHRKLDDGELYFVTNRRNRAERIEARFRVTGRQPEIWRATTGVAEPVSYRIEGNETVLPLDVSPEDAFFILFRKPAASPSLTIASPAMTEIATLTAPWTVRFQPGRGAPGEVMVNSLAPLNVNADPGIRYFSGTATYDTTIRLPEGYKSGAPLWLDLGQVGDVAEVRVNGRLVGTSWLAPYRLNVAPYVVKGRNRLEVSVANLWVNRLIGDRQPGATKITSTSSPTYRANAPLRPSGLIGPVRLFSRPGQGE